MKQHQLDLPEVISLAKNEVSFGVESRANLAQPAVAAAALQAVFMPVHVQGLEEVSEKLCTCHQLIFQNGDRVS